MPVRRAVCGMTLKASPALKVVTEMTADSTGSTLRETTDWRAVMMCAPTSVVSMQRCGLAAWPPRPSMSITKISAAAIMEPLRSENWPKGMPGALCMP